MNGKGEAKELNSYIVLKCPIMFFTQHTCFLSLGNKMSALRLCLFTGRKARIKELCRVVMMLIG